MNNSKNTMKTQVVIIGAGPTGLSMAAQFIRHSIDFVIIEKNTTTTSLSKALVVHARTLEIFRELGIAEKAIATGQIATALNIMKNGRQKARLDMAELGKGLSEFPFILSLEQSKTENLLHEFLTQNKKTVLWESTLTHFEQNKDGVHVYYKDIAGEKQIIEAEYLVGCDGAHSLVRHQLDLSFDGETVPKFFYVADVIINSEVINKKEIYSFLTKRGFIFFFAMEEEGRYRIIGILPHTVESNAPVEFKDIQDSIVKEVMCPLEFTALKWFSTYKISSRKARVFAKERTFICGDAAHIHTPAGGQGMNTGIQDAYNLAWKIAFTLQQKINLEVLRSYSKERSKNAANLLKTTDMFFDILSGKTAFWNFFRQYILPSLMKFISHNSFAKKKVFPMVSQTSIAYRDSYLTDDSKVGKIKAGDRMPYFITSTGNSVYDSLMAPKFKLLYFGTGEIKKDILSTYKVPYEIYCFKDIPASLFGKEREFYILLRPDNHISYTGKDISRCHAFLNKISDH